MNSMNRIIRIADMFERKLRKIAGPSVSDGKAEVKDENPKAIVSDVIFDNHPTRNQDFFLKYLLNVTSNFQKAISGVTGSINIGGKVNVPQNMIEITVTCPQEKDVKLVNKIKLAVLADYKGAYGKSPQDRLKQKKLNKDVQADAVAEHDAIITF